MAMLKMKSIRELNEKDLRDRIEQMKTELSKLKLKMQKEHSEKKLEKLERSKKRLQD